MSTVVLYGTFGSPTTRSAQLGLEEKNVPYEFVEVAYGEHVKLPHLERHPFGRVPVVDHDGFRLYETQAILRYLDAVFPEPPLRPQQAREAARMDQMIGIVDWYFFHQVTTPLSWQRLAVPRYGGQSDEKVIADAVPKAEVCVREISRLLGTKPYLAGAQITIADLMLAPQLTYLAMTPEGAAMLGAYPRLTEWLARMAQRPSMKKTNPMPAAQAA